MKTLTVKDFNKIPLKKRVIVWAPDVSKSLMNGHIEGNEYLKDNFVQLDNGEEIFVNEIKAIWGVNENGEREEL